MNAILKMFFFKSNILKPYWESICQFTIALKAFLLFFAILIISCNECPAPSPDDTERDIYFTSLPLGTTIPIVCGIMKDGTSFKMIFENGVLASPITHKGKMAIWNDEYNGDTAIYRFDLTRNSSEKYLPNNTFNHLGYPIISPDGKFTIARYSIASLLRIDGLSLGKEILNNTHDNSLASISKDSRYFAIIKSLGLEFNFELSVLSLADPDVVISNINIINDFDKWNSISSIDWTSDGSICYVDKEILGAKDKIKIFDPINSVLLNSIEINIGASQPTVSPDNSQIAFIGDDGNIWRVVLNSELRFFKITNAQANKEYYQYPKWSADGKQILVNKYNFYGYGDFDSDLMVIDLQSNLQRILSKNAFMGFWRR